VKEVTRKLGNG